MQGPCPLELAVLPTESLDAPARAEIVDLCNRAFEEEDFSNLFDFVQGCDHVLARRDGVLVGHAVWSTRRLQPEGYEPLRTAYVDAVATDPALWGHGIGRAVMERLAAETGDFELRGLSTDRPGFYERLGWQRWLGPTAVRTSSGIQPAPDNIVMVLPTPYSPSLDLRSQITADWRPGQPW